MRQFTLQIREEDGTYWGDVKELPGCFFSGRDLDELKEVAIAAIRLYLDNGESGKAPSKSMDARVDEMRVLVPA